ncbi:hypothetical protein [Streptomyces griseocarneus]|uniref:hypothetical protein n=1 Tax=Streptomyces griseocarneus TaxID=51201 RepID=UPI00167D390B|nr:hypothetical protein [Streptomyces griseocarneus]MBZ6476416.1 hypothetical protein [Streptomyces griseocarneus]GHG79049.1 hypothetical protein GCM10018779_59590 [Streptomyces griseocarneus]
MAKPKPPRPPKAAKSAAAAAIKKRGVKVRSAVPKGGGSLKGRVIAPTRLLAKAFTASFTDAISREATAQWELGTATVEEYRRLVIRAYRQITDKHVTASAWVGKLLEVLAPNLPEVRLVMDAMAAEHVDLVNLAVHGRRAVFVNGRLDTVKVTSEFTSKRIITDTWLKVPEKQPRGAQYVDHAYLYRNAQGQELLVTFEFKCRGQGKKLRAQMAMRDIRLLELSHVPGVILTFLTRGKPDSVAVDKLVIAPGEGARLGRMGIKAGRNYKVEEALDASGDPYMRLTVPINTDVHRRILERVLRDRSWQ